MDLRELLGMLDMPPGESYYRSRIPCPEDEQVARVVRAFSESSPGRQAVFREAIDGAIDRLVADGTVRRIYARYGIEHRPPLGR